jgi:predicted Ser/Thr protein kinase/tetratricopeptide (TPR) repeat protein
LSRALSDDPEGAAEVRELLRFHDDSASFLEQPVVPGIVTPGSIDGSADALVAGTRLGSFTIVRTLGIGGMGVVYLAEQEYPRRTVALKLIRTGVASSQSLRRFEREAEVLGRLQHAGIAQIYEAGTLDTPRGRQPYFAMEYVAGRPLLDAARELPVRARLEILAQICDAIQHAHAKGVVHRDLKPGNILVDAEGRAKVLDFGVARVTGGDHAATMRTDMGQLIGTLAYMSPEQVAGDPTAVDPRSDVYALGVILYELLSGRLPHDTKKRSVPEVVRAIREDDPPSLSSLDHRYRGDVEIIVARALEKDPARRYPTAEDFAKDIRRYLADEPIVARSPSAMYQFGKFARRNRGLVAGLAAAALLLIVGTAVSTTLAIKASRERDRARDAESRAAEQRRRAIEEAKTSREVTDLVRKMLAAADPSRGQGRGVTVEAMLDAEAQRLDSSSALDDRPLVKAALHDTIGQTYFSLGRWDDALKHSRAAYDLIAQKLGSESVEAVRALVPLARVIPFAKGNDAAWKEIQDIMQRVERVLGPDDEDTFRSRLVVRQFQIRSNLREIAPHEVPQVFERAVHLFGPESDVALEWMQTLSGMYILLGDSKKAEELGAKLLEIQERVRGIDAPETLEAVSTLANAYMIRRDYDRAEPHWVRLAEGRKRVLGAKHSASRQAIHMLASFYQMRGDSASAERVSRELIALGEEVGEDVRVLVGYRRQLAAHVEAQGRWEEGEVIRAQVLEQMRDVAKSETHRDVLRSKVELAANLARQGRAGEADALALGAFEAAVDQRGAIEDHWIALIATAYGRSLIRCARFDASQEWWARARPYVAENPTPRTNPAVAKRELDRLQDEISKREPLPGNWIPAWGGP